MRSGFAALLGRSRVVGYAWALLLVAAVSAAIAAVRAVAPAPDLAMLYVVAVLAAAVTAGRGSAVLAALAAFAAYDLLFTKPYFTWTVANPSEWVTLAFLLLTGLVTGQLTAVAERRAEEARQNERNATVQYQLARLLAAAADVDGALPTVAAVLREATEAAAVRIALPTGAETADGTAEATRYLRQAGRFGRGRVLSNDPRERTQEQGHLFRPRRWIRLRASLGRRAEDAYDLYHVRVESGGEEAARDGQPEGWLTVARPRGSAPLTAPDQRLLLAAAGELTDALDRERLRREATQVEVLRQADDLKNALLNTVSHDLRTPLAAVVASAESLLQEDVAWSDEERREFLESIAAEGRRLDQLVRHLLDLSRVEAGSVRIAREWRDPAVVATDAVERLRALYPERTMRVEAAEVPPVRLDVIAIGEVITNLVENACRHTPERTSVTVSVRGGVDGAEFCVDDDGPGIPADVLPHLFEPFYRTRGLRDRRGTGLGLAVAKALVRAHGGDLRAENLPTGGARFAFTLPWSPDAPPDAAAGEGVP